MSTFTNKTLMIAGDAGWFGKVLNVCCLQSGID